MKQLVIRGFGSIRGAGILIRLFRAKRVFVFYGNSSFKKSGFIEIAEALKNVKIRYCNNVPPNPEIERIRSYSVQFRMFNPDFLIAIGGGSIIDTAKCVLAFSSRESEGSILKNNFHLGNKKIPFLAIPTTAGSGSESTHFAVLYKENIKYSIANEFILPNLVLLDPLLTLSCSRKVTVSGFLDAICQAVESIWSKGSISLSRHYSFQSIRSMLPNVPQVLAHPEDRSTRAKLLIGAHLAGKAINISKTTAGHALSYGLTSQLGISHGLAVMLVMKELVNIMDKKYGYFKNGSMLDRLFRTYGKGFPDAFNEFISFIQANIDKSDYGVRQGLNMAEVRKNLLSTVNIERLTNHPIEIDQEDIETIYDNVIEYLTKVTMPVQGEIYV